MDEHGISECFDREAGCCTPRIRRRRRSRSQPLANALEEAGIQSMSVLEIGCGVGELARELAQRGAGSVTGIDLSAESVSIANQEAVDEGLAGKVRFEVGNGAVEPLESHDVVVLDRVVCCYPGAEELITHTSDAAGRVFAFTVPRNEGVLRLYWRLGFGVENTYHALRRRQFRAYLHDLGHIDAWLRERGLAPAQRFSRRGWLHAVYVRPERRQTSV
jgi:SAM-dependent methyltransferase